MISFEFLQFIEPYKKKYEQFPLPVIITDTSLEVCMSNLKSKSFNFLPSKTKDLTMVLSELDTKEIETVLQKEGRYIASGIIPLMDFKLYIFPIYKERDILGFEIIVAEEDFEKPAAISPDFISKTSDSIVNQVTESLSNIFIANDNLVLKSDLLESSWVVPYVNKINIEGYKILRLSNNVNIYNKLQNSIIEPGKCVYDLSGWLDKIEPIVEALIKEKNIEFKIEKENKAIFVPLDIELFQTAFFNILHNCIYYSKEGSKILVCLKEKEGFVELIIEDNGMGIDNEILETIKKPFFSSFKHKYLKSVGLGIPISSRIIDIHNGTFEVETVLNEKTKVKITLPSNIYKHELKLAQGTDKDYFRNKFSPIYIGLTSALDSPF